MEKSNWKDALKVAKKARAKSIYDFIEWRYLLTTGNRASFYDYKNFIEDINPNYHEINTQKLMSMSKTFFKKNGLLINWREFEKLDQVQKINTLAMIAPLTNEEKQKLLEAISLDSKVKTLESIISFYLHDSSLNNQTLQ